MHLKEKIVDPIGGNIHILLISIRSNLQVEGTSSAHQ